MSSFDPISPDISIPTRRFAGAFSRGGLYLLDLASAVAAIQVSVFVQFGLSFPSDFIGESVETGLVMAAICAVVLPLAGLYNRHWRYASIGDLVAIALATLSSSSLLAIALVLLPGLSALPPSLAIIQLFVLTAILSTTRLAFRREEVFSALGFLRRDEHEGHKPVPVLLVGTGEGVDLYLRALWSDPNRSHAPVGVLEEGARGRGLHIRGVPVLGSPEDFERVHTSLARERRAPRNLVFTDPPSRLGPERVERLVLDAERLGIEACRVASPTEFRSAARGQSIELKPIEVTDLLERPQAALARDAMRSMIEGRRVLLTGAGGSIGSELARQIAALEPAEIVLIDNSEYNLYAIDADLAERFDAVRRTAHLCNVRDANRVNELFATHRPEFVFHAAALKHVPMVELNPCEGVLTNIVGTRNVASAAADFGARAMVQVSTDKVVNPTSVMGATKRVAELYCQALDLEAGPASDTTRFMTVRFGNVLGSSGSLIPLFRRQLERGGPLTVTDPKMTRYFMTIREAVELTLHAAAHGVRETDGRGRICVLDMGDPVRVIDIARRMIRLAGYVPEKEIPIEFIGARPGEKLFEELFDDGEERLSLEIPGVMGAMPRPIPLERIERKITRLQTLASLGDGTAVRAALATLVPTYRSALRATSSVAPPPPLSPTPVSAVQPAAE